jgi:hypothetical protein
MIGHLPPWHAKLLISAVTSEDRRYVRWRTVRTLLFTIEGGREEYAVVESLRVFEFQPEGL